VEDVTTADVKKAIDGWNARADQEAWSIAIEQVAGGYRLATRPEYAQYVSRLYAGRQRFRLSRAGLETLAIVAYKQPITRAEIESIRGVGAGSGVANLMERSWVEIVGKAKVLGAPFLYGTTQEFSSSTWG
jgi:segregation and condensation protein B